jgi:hypothetical protein
LEAIGLLALIRHRLGGLQGQQMLTGGLQALAAGLAMTIGVSLWLSCGPENPDWLVTAGGVILGAGIFALAALLLGVPEVRRVWNAFVSRAR